MDEIISVFSSGVGKGILFANIVCLGGWAIRQLIIFFKNLVMGGF